ncbi:MAG TPA: hypothetical protein VFN55_17255 [Solirubrobacteraceae bacterium]|nr:hypothetical protein [Solirubrobacteraceae bacterium]
MSATAPPAERHRCACEREFQVFGRGRHRLYFAISDTGFADPVMSGLCPGCGQVLPGKHGRRNDGGV